MKWLNWFLKPELSKNRRNSGLSPDKRFFLNFSSFVLYFFLKFCTLIQNTYIVTEPDFWKKNFFSGRKCCGNMPVNRYFGIFSRFHHYIFWFFAQRCILSVPKTCPSPIFEMPEICRKSPFFLILSGRFLCFFFHIKYCW